MQTQEQLKTTEVISQTTEDNTVSPTGLNKTETEKIYYFRQGLLEKIRSIIGLKFYHQISEKLENEKSIFEKLLNLEDVKQDFLSHYSFVLNPHYFEQQLMN